MKIPIHARSSLAAASASGRRPAPVRPKATKTIEHRYARRKIREQLRRLDWVPDAEDANFA
jgi:hypothetical protein